MSDLSSCGPEMVRRLQERAARALPAEHVEYVGGWWLRHTTSSAWWVGSVLPHADAGPDELERGIVAAEKFYAEHGATPRLQICPPACPRALDTRLAARGYRHESPMSLQVAAATQVAQQAPRDALRVRLDDGPTSAWFEVWCALHGHGGEPRAEWNMFGRVERPSAYATVMVGDRVVAVGRVVAEDGWAGVFGMGTLPHARGKGAAQCVLAAMAHWSRAQGAHHMYLQVDRDNGPALRLYERAGFGEVCAYHYRTAG